MVAAFIRENGVTKCPGMGTRELALLNIEREKAWQAMTPQQRWQAASPGFRRGRAATLTAEEKKERQREYQRQYYAANRGKKAARDREHMRPA